MINERDAIMLVMSYAGLEGRPVENRQITCSDGLYEVCFRTTELVYDCYVDAASGEILGFSFEPRNFSLS